MSRSTYIHSMSTNWLFQNNIWHIVWQVERMNDNRENLEVEIINENSLQHHDHLLRIQFNSNQNEHVDCRDRRRQKKNLTITRLIKDFLKILLFREVYVGRKFVFWVAGRWQKRKGCTMSAPSHSSIIVGWTDNSKPWSLISASNVWRRRHCPLLGKPICGILTNLSRVMKLETRRAEIRNK